MNYKLFGITALLFSCLLCVDAQAQTPARDLLPLLTGIFVEQSAPCENPPIAAMLHYGGGGESIANVHTHCVIANIIQSDTDYTLQESCNPQGSSDMFGRTTTVKIPDKEHFTINGTTYRYCEKKLEIL